MKIVDVAEFYAEEGGGVRSYIHQKLRAAAARGHEMVVVAPGQRDGEEERLGGRIVWVPGPPMPFDPRYTVLWRRDRVHAILDRERPDMLEGSSPWTGGWFAAGWAGAAPRVLVAHSEPVATYPLTLLDRALPVRTIDRLLTPYWRSLRALAGRYDATVVAGRWMAGRLGQNGIPRVAVVPFGTDKARFSPDRADPALRRELLARCGLGPDAALLVAMGRLNPEKRLGTVLAAAQRARPGRPVGLVLVGGGPLAGWVQRRIGRMRGIHLLGFVDDPARVAALLASADAVLHGCAAETFGMAVAEGLCSGTPAVVARDGGAADLVDPACSETYRPGDADGAARAVERLLARDPEALRQGALAAAARISTVAEHFDALFDLYARLAAAPALTR